MPENLCKQTVVRSIIGMIASCGAEVEEIIFERLSKRRQERRHKLKAAA